MSKSRFYTHLSLLAALLLSAPSAWSIVAGQGPGAPTESDFQCLEADCVIGSAVDPIPIELDPSAPPWLKQISGLTGQTVIMIHEYLVNTGNRSITDWHEEIVEPTPPGWGWSTTSPDTGVFILGTLDLVPGLVIDFGPDTGSGPTSIDFFFDPIKPGEGFEIWKTLEWMGPGQPPPGSIAIKQYPTPVPAAFWLLGSALAGLVVSRRRKH